MSIAAILAALLAAGLVHGTYAQPPGLVVGAHRADVVRQHAHRIVRRLAGLRCGSATPLVAPGHAQSCVAVSFPDDYMAGARQFPSLVPIMPDNPAIAANRAAWQVLEQWQKPFLTAFSDNDPVTAGRHVRFEESIPGARRQEHATIAGAGGHFLQEEKPVELAAAVLRFMADNPR